MLTIEYGSRFKADYKRALKRGCNPAKLEAILTILQNGGTLPAKNKDHALIGNYKGWRECHIEPDWLLIYKIDGNRLVLLLNRTGTHSDLF